MRSHSSWSIVVVVLGCLLTLLIGARAAPDAKWTFQSLYSQLDQATVNKDVNAVISIYSPDYIGVRENGEKYGFDHMRDGTLKLFAKYKAIRSKTVVQSAVVEKNGATVVTHYHGAYIRDSDVPGQEVTITVVSVDRDYWVKSSGGWKLKQERHLSSHQTRNVSAVQ